MYRSRPGEEVKPHAGRRLKAWILLIFLRNIGIYELNRSVKETVFDICQKTVFLNSKGHIVYPFELISLE